MDKGGEFERKTCKFLSLWWTDGKYKDVFWRSRVKSTRESPNAKHQLGDIKAERPEGQPLVDVFSIELKSGYSKGKKGKTVKNVPWDLLDLIDYRKGSEALEKKQIFVFWQQTVKDAEISNRKPLLIFKRDFHLPVVCITSNCMGKLESFQGKYKGRLLCFENDNEELLVFVRVESFFEWLNPETVKMFDK